MANRRTANTSSCRTPTLRRTARDGEFFPGYAVATWWTNLPDDADIVVRLHHDHATCGQFHNELKSDMGVERLPSGKCVYLT